MAAEPPACIQNAMMTKDKKPFTYTPGGLDLSQIRTPSMARRFARQHSHEDHEQPQGQPGGGSYHPQGGPVPPPPPPPKAPAPPPPPPIVIDVPNLKANKPVPLGERPEIVIPENPIGMLRKTNSPYHWEAEKADMQRMGPVPKFQEKVPSPLTVKMPPSTFTQQPQNYTPPGQNRQNYYGNNCTPDSPIHKPEAQYAHQKSASPNANGSPPTRELLQRQDSQFNKSPQPFASQSPFSNGSPFSPSPNNNWKQPERRDSPSNNGPQFQRGTFSPNSQQFSPNYQNQSPPATGSPGFHTLPRTSNAIYNNTREASPKTDVSNATPWRTNTLNRQPREPENLQNIYHNSPNSNQQSTYSPPWKTNDSNNNDNSYRPQLKQENKNQNTQSNNQQYTPPWATSQGSNDKKVQDNNNYQPPWRSQETDRVGPASPPNRNQQETRYQSSMSIPVTPRKQNTQPEYNNNSTPQKEVVFVNQEPVYYCPDRSQNMPPWVKTQKEKTKTPPPAWCNKPLEGRRSAPRELATPPRDMNQEPLWMKKSNEMQNNVREVVSPPKYQQSVQPSPPTWSTRPSENRKSVPRETAPNSMGNRVIPVQMEMSTEARDQNGQGKQPQQLRIVIDMQQNPSANRSQAPLSQPTQRIMRVLSPQLVRLDDGPQQPELPTLNTRNFQGYQDAPVTRIIPIQLEGGGSVGGNKR
jgi:hypothetical protein